MTESVLEVDRRGGLPKWSGKENVSVVKERSCNSGRLETQMCAISHHHFSKMTIRNDAFGQPFEYHIPHNSNPNRLTDEHLLVVAVAGENVDFKSHFERSDISSCRVSGWHGVQQDVDSVEDGADSKRNGWRGNTAGGRANSTSPSDGDAAG